MSLPATFLTTTCDIYRNNPPMFGANPAATNVPCQLVPDYAGGSRPFNNTIKSWTHYLLLDTSVDIRDAYGGSQSFGFSSNADTTHIPSGGTTPYAVVFVEVVGKGTPNEHKRAYLDRQTPAWPAL